MRTKTPLSKMMLLVFAKNRGNLTALSKTSQEEAVNVSLGSQNKLMNKNILTLDCDVKLAEFVIPCFIAGVVHDLMSSCVVDVTHTAGHNFWSHI